MKRLAKALKENLLFQLVCLLLVILLVQGLAAYFTNWKEAQIQAGVSIATTMVGIGSSWLLASLAEQQRIKQKLDTLIAEIEKAFSERRRETFNAAINWYAELSKDYRNPFAHDERLSKLYFSWVVQMSVEQGWAETWSQFSGIAERFRGYEPLASLFEERLASATKMEELVQCLKELPTLSSLQWLSFNKIQVADAAKANTQLLVRLRQFALTLELKTTEENSLFKYVFKQVLGGELPKLDFGEIGPDWFDAVGIDYQRAKEALQGHTEDERNLVGNEYAVQIVTARMERHHIALTGGRGQGKTFAKEQFKAECKNNRQMLYAEWKDWKKHLDGDRVSREDLRTGFFADLRQAYQEHDELKGLVQSADADISSFKKMLNTTSIQIAFLVLDLGNITDLPYLDNDYERMKLLFYAIPRTELFTGNPRFYLRLFSDSIVLQHVRSRIEDPISEIPIVWHREHKIDLLKTRVEYIKSNPSQNPFGIYEDHARENDSDRTLLLNDFVSRMNTPRDIVTNLWRIMNEQAKIFNPKDPTSAYLSRQVYDKVLDEWSQASRA